MNTLDATPFNPTDAGAKPAYPSESKNNFSSKKPEKETCKTAKTATAHFRKRTLDPIYDQTASAFSQYSRNTTIDKMKIHGALDTITEKTANVFYKILILVDYNSQVKNGLNNPHHTLPIVQENFKKVMSLSRNLIMDSDTPKLISILDYYEKKIDRILKMHDSSVMSRQVKNVKLINSIYGLITQKVDKFQKEFNSIKDGWCIFPIDDIMDVD